MSEAPAVTETPAVATPSAPVADGVNTFSLDYVKQLRDEAAGHRTAKVSAVEEAKAALTTEFDTERTEAATKFAEQATTLSARELDLVKLKAVLTSEDPEGRILGLTSLVQGNDEATITEHVKTVKALLGTAAPGFVPAVDPSQGGGGKPPIPLNGDPILAKLKEKLNIT